MTSQQPRPNDRADPGTEGSPLNTPVRVAPRHEAAGLSWLTFAGFVYLTFNSAMAIYHDVADISFVVASYFDLVLLFYCLKRYKKASPGSPQRDRLKICVWVLTTILTASFTYEIMGTARLTLPMAMLVLAIAAAIGIGASYAFFEQDRLNPLPDEATRPPV